MALNKTFNIFDGSQEIQVTYHKYDKADILRDKTFTFKTIDFKEEYSITIDDSTSITNTTSILIGYNVVFNDNRPGLGLAYNITPHMYGKKDAEDNVMRMTNTPTITIPVMDPNEYIGEDLIYQAIKFVVPAYEGAIDILDEGQLIELDEYQMASLKETIKDQRIQRIAYNYAVNNKLDPQKYPQSQYRFIINIDAKNTIEEYINQKYTELENAQTLSDIEAIDFSI